MGRVVKAMILLVLQLGIIVVDLELSLVYLFFGKGWFQSVAEECADFSAAIDTTIGRLGNRNPEPL